VWSRVDVADALCHAFGSRLLSHKKAREHILLTGSDKASVM
jgi:hypothetical protein